MPTDSIKLGPFSDWGDENAACMIRSSCVWIWGRELRRAMMMEVEGRLLEEGRVTSRLCDHVMDGFAPTFV